MAQMAGGRGIDKIIIDRMIIKVIITSCWWTQEKRLLRRQSHRQGCLYGAAVAAAAAVGHQNASAVPDSVRGLAIIASEFLQGRTRDPSQRVLKFKTDQCLL